MSITELIEQLNAMPEKMEGFNSEGELVVLNTHKASEVLKKSLRNCDVGTVAEQDERFDKYCYDHRLHEICCDKCPIFGEPCCEFAWAQMPYEEGGVNGK